MPLRIQTGKFERKTRKISPYLPVTWLATCAPGVRSESERRRRMSEDKLEVPLQKSVRACVVPRQSPASGAVQHAGRRLYECAAAPTPPGLPLHCPLLLSLYRVAHTVSIDIEPITLQQIIAYFVHYERPLCTFYKFALIILCPRNILYKRERKRQHPSSPPPFSPSLFNLNSLQNSNTELWCDHYKNILQLIISRQFQYREPLKSL